MPRSTAALFTPLFTSITLALICYPAMHAFFSSTVSADYSPLMRSSLLSSLVIIVATCLLQLILSAAQKSSIIGGAELVDPRHALHVANASCCSSAFLLLLFVSCFLQATTYSSQLDPVPNLKRGGSSQQADWMHAVAGASGGWMQPVAAPFMGSIYGGMISAYLVLMFLLSIYVSYMATPDLASSYLFMEPRFLVIASGFLGFGVGQTVAGSFASCADATGSIVGFSCFALAACFFDLLVGMLVGSSVLPYAKWIGLQGMAIVPLFFFLSRDVPATIQASCGIAVAAASIVNAVDLAFRDWNSDIPREEVPVAAVAVAPASAAALFERAWHIPSHEQQHAAIMRKRT